ncbi:MAG: DNA-3-methyladenine glycosylase I, partial [Pseudomonadota bacterium]
RRLFAKFDPKKVARFTPARIEKILKNPAIIRNRLKVNSAVTNARAFLQIQKEFGSFDRYVWDFVGGETIVKRPKSLKDYRPTSPESDRLSADLKKRGFKFVGSTVIYAHLQATGLIDEHSVNCFRSSRKFRQS